MAQNKFVITVKSKLGKHGWLDLLIDTGSSACLLKIDHIDQEAFMDVSDKIRIGGAFGGIETTFGSITTDLDFDGKISKKCKFHVVKNYEAIVADGILGADFIQNTVIMDCVGNVMYCCDDTGKKLVEISNNFGIDKTIMEDIAPWEKYSKGMGQRLLLKQGYELGKGLGVRGQGIIKPILSTNNKGDRRGFGYDNDFKENRRDELFKICETLEINEIKDEPSECYDDFVLALREIDWEITTKPWVKNTTFEYLSVNYKIRIKARMEEIVPVRIKCKGKRYCPGVQIQEGVFAANSIVKSENGYARIAIINSNLQEVEISNFYPKTEPLNKFKMMNLMESAEMPEKVKQLRFNKLIEIIKPNELEIQEEEVLNGICWNYQDIFHLPGDKLTFTNVKKFKLPLNESSKIINRKQYRLPEKHRGEIQKQIEKLKEDDIIENSISPFNSPVILVPKKGVDVEGNKLYRMCVDFRELNKVCIPYSFPLPRIEDILDQLGGSTYFSVLDLSQGFHQVLIDEQDREKTAFSSSYGHYQYKRCPFGLKTLPGFFQSLLNGILTGLQGIKCFVYIDDVVIFSSSLEDHVKRLTDIFQRFRETNLKLNPQKCNFFRKEIMYLGHKCSMNGVEPDQRLVKAVQDFSIPKNIKNLQSFLGLANYYRQFIKNFAKKAGPLYSLLKGSISSSNRKDLDWNESCDEAFEILKNALTTSPVLAYPDFEKDFSITCDASIEGLGAVLEQDKRVIVYASRTLLDTEKRWSATELELNAVVFGWQVFKPYVLGRHVKVYSDHMPLKGVLKMNDTASRIVRLQQKLLDFDYEIIHKVGKENNCADFLSRNPIRDYRTTLVIVKKPQAYSENLSTVTIEDYDSDDSLDASLHTIDSYKVEPPDEVPNNSLTDCFIVTRQMALKNLEIEKEVKINSTEGNTDKQQPTIRPASRDIEWEDLETNNNDSDDEMEILRNKAENANHVKHITRPPDMKIILKDYHDSMFGGHFGVVKTYSRIKKKFYWKGMKRYITQYIANCEICQKHKSGRSTKMQLCKTDLSRFPFEKVFIDIVGPLPMSASGNINILTMVDDLTRFVEFTAIPDQTANTVARALFEQILCRYTIPKVIISDNGSNFTSEIFAELCKLLKIDKRHISPFSPQGNLVERQHLGLANYLRCFVENDQTSWDTYLRTAAHAYNNTVHVSTGFAPMELLYGFVSEIPSNLKTRPTPIYNHDAYYHELRYKLQMSYKYAREKLEKAKAKSKDYYDEHINPKVFKKGQFVWMQNMYRTSKFSAHWVGPYEILEVHNEYNVTCMINRKRKKVHVNRLKPASRYKKEK